MAEKWHEFVTRIKNETKVGSLQEAMKIASSRKSEWNRAGAPQPSKSKKNKSKHNKTGRKK